MADYLDGLMVQKYLTDTLVGTFPCLVCGMECKSWKQYMSHMRGIVDVPGQNNQLLLSELQQQKHDDAGNGNEETEDEDHTLMWGTNKNDEDESKYVFEGEDHLNNGGKLLVMPWCTKL